MELSTWLQALPDKTRKGLTIVDESHVYHISTNANIKQFIPMVGSRQMPTEDRTVPRVCCARSIVDAVRGHAAVSGQAINRWKAGNAGVFYIYRLPFKRYVKPLPSIVPDSGLTNELWVVPNDPQTAMFRAQIVGEFIVSAVSEEYEEGELEHSFTLMLHTNEPVRLCGNTFLNGYGKIELEREAPVNAPVRSNGHAVEEMVPISADEYQSVFSKLVKNVSKG